MNITKELLTLNQDIAGQEIGIPVYRITADSQNLPTVYIQSAVHAAEMQGSAVIFKLIDALKITNLKANIILVPNCNPFGRTQRAGEYLQGRFDATTGNNWNRFYHFNSSLPTEFATEFSNQLDRQVNDQTTLNKSELPTAEQLENQAITMFRAELIKSLERLENKDWGINTAQFLNHKLQLLATEADYVIDLHTGPSSTRHIYSPEFLALDAESFNIENIISIPVEFAGALDEASFTPWVKLAAALESKGIPFNYRVKAFTVELGSQENICLTQAEEDANGILNYLADNNLIANSPVINKCQPIVTLLKDYKTLFSSHAGMVEYLAKAGDKVKKGQPIARVLNSLEFDSAKAVTEINSPATGIVILHYPSAAVQIGTQLYKIAITQN